MVDVGNSHTVVGIFRGDKVVDHWRLTTRPNTSSDEVLNRVSGLLRFSEIKPNLGIEEGGLESAAPSLATSKRDELQKPNFSGSKPKSEIQGGEIEDAEVSKATKSDIENGKYFFGGISKNELVKEKLPRPKPSEDLSEPIKNK